MAMPSHPRIGILGSLIKGLPDLWPRLNDETAFGHFFDMTKNNLVIYIPDLMPGALVSGGRHFQSASHQRPDHGGWHLWGAFHLIPHGQEKTTEFFPGTELVICSWPCACAPATKFVAHLTDSFSPWLLRYDKK